MRNLSFVLLDMSQHILCHIWMCWDKSHVANNTNKRFLITLCFISVAYLQLDMSQPILCHIWMWWDKSQVASNTQKKNFSSLYLSSLLHIFSKHEPDLQSTNPTCKATNKTDRHGRHGKYIFAVLIFFWYSSFPSRGIASQEMKWYGVATISRLLKIIGLFCRIASLL